MAFTNFFKQFLSNFCPKICMRIFVKKRMRSHGMPMVFQIGSLASLATKTKRSLKLQPEGSTDTKVIPLGLADITRGL